MLKNSKRKKCAYCGKEFSTFSPKRMYCCDYCRRMSETKLDKLTRDAMAAEADGLSYGQYMAKKGF